MNNPIVGWAWLACSVMLVLLSGYENSFASAFSFGFEEDKRTDAEKACDLKVEEQARKAMASILRVTKLFRKFEEVANDLYNKLDALQKVYAQVQGSFTNEQKNHEETKKLLENLNKAKLEAASELETLHKENDELKKVLAATKENYIKVETTLKEKEEKYKVLEEDNTIQKSKVAHFTNLVNVRDATIIENRKKCDETVKNEKDAKEACQTKLTTQAQENSEQIASINTKCNQDKTQLNAAITSLKKNVEDCENSKSTLKTEKDNIAVQLGTVKTQLEAEKSNYETLKQTSLEQKTQLDKNIQDLMAQIAKLKKEKIASDTLHENYKKEKEIEIVQLKKYKVDLTALNEQCTNDKNALNTANVKLKEDFNSKVTELTKLEETKNAEIAKLTQANKDLITQSEEDLKRLKDEHAKATTLSDLKISQLETEIKTCKANNQDLIGKLTQLEETKKQEISKLNNDIATLKTAHETALKALAEKSLADLTKLKTEKDTLIQKLINDYKNLDETKKQEISKLAADTLALKTAHQAALKTMAEKCLADLMKLNTEKNTLIQKLTTDFTNLEATRKQEADKCAAEKKNLEAAWQEKYTNLINIVKLYSEMWKKADKYAKEPQTCFKEWTKGSEYIGTLSKTRSGRPCQNWGSNYPHTISGALRNPMNYPEKSLESAKNYCRNPNGIENAPWCYTLDPKVRWEYCNVPKCPKLANCYKISTRGRLYNGRVYKTKSGRTCQKWASNTPHAVGTGAKNPFNFPDASILEADNYCRNPGSEPMPWCYTTDPKVRWEYCNIPKCAESCYMAQYRGREYSGYVAKTQSGRFCQKWASQTPHSHQITSAANFPDATLAEASNYCRNPGAEARPWCYTTDTQVRWEYCNIPKCTIRENCYNVPTKGMDFNSELYTKTRSGRVCQKWAMNYPHGISSAVRNPLNFPDQSYIHASNYCRNPDNSPAPWCYTTDPKLRWEFCNVPRCPAKCYIEATKGRDYTGTVAKTRSGRTCQKWTANSPHAISDQLRASSLYPDGSAAAASNYCRNPDGSEMPWCYTTTSVRWEYCNIPKCKPIAKCYNKASKGADYTGIISKTRSGRVCQRWISNYPHTHQGKTKDPAYFPDLSLYEAKNYCRNPDGSEMPWCYTLHPSARWEYCNVPACA